MRFAQVRSLPRNAIEEREHALQLALEVVALEPDWIAPRRFVDDVMRELLRGPEALARRRADLSLAPDDPAQLYLVGRLEGPAGKQELERAARVGDGAWMQHGRAWNHFMDGSPKSAARYGQRALDRARDPYERAFFSRVLSRYYAALGREESSREVLFDATNAGDLEPVDAAELALLLLETFLQSEEINEVDFGFDEGLKALALSDDKGLLAIFGVLWAARAVVSGAEDALLGALRSHTGPVASRIRARIHLQRGSYSLALAALGEAEIEWPNTQEWRKARMAVGDARGAIEDWLTQLPAQVVDAQGMPLDDSLRRLANAARQDDVETLATALLVCGWFEELSGLCEELSRTRPALALTLDAHAAVGRAALHGTHGLLKRLDEGGEVGLVGRSGVDGELGSKGRGLEDLLAAMQPYFSAWDQVQNGTESFGRLQDTPRFSFGPFANMVHPGPTFSAWDERSGRGKAGQRVPGLASALASMGRFGVFGRAPGLGGPDGTILRRLHIEEIAKTQLGVEFEGTVAWCEGLDIPSRPARRGAGITGAALHEGYWIDIEGIRSEARNWKTLERTWLREAPEAMRTALEDRGPMRRSGEPFEFAANPLGEASRVRLAVLRDRATLGESVTLEDLIEVTARHEEGHLMDRVRYLPITKNILRGLGLLIQGGFSAGGVARRLEYRAQLVALCVSEDARIALSDILAAAEFGGSVTSHAAAYTGLLDDLLGILARDEAVRASPGMDRERFLIFQLHFLDSSTIRRAARKLARAEAVARR